MLRRSYLRLLLELEPRLARDVAPHRLHVERLLLRQLRLQRALLPAWRWRHRERLCPELENPRQM